VLTKIATLTLSNRLVFIVVMDALIHSVNAGSIAQDIGIHPGCRVLAVNGKTDLEDMLDYQYEVSGAELVELHIQYPTGEEEIIEIEKDADDGLGINFSSPLFSPIRTCNNACPFCFIDQQPAGLRPSLYVKDDDYRLSYFNNTYITLTNLTARDRARIERLRPGPLYISVHASDPDIRRQLLKNPKAQPIMDDLRWLKSLDIPFHCQVVLCPGINDGEVLANTLRDLATLRPAAESVAIVPLGLTMHRDQLTDLTPVTDEVAVAVLSVVEAFQAHTPAFAYPSDEWYFKAGRPVPALGSELPQLDDGVGTARLLTERFYQLQGQLPAALPAPRHVLIATGRLAAMTLQPLAQEMNAVEHLHVDVMGISSPFWGEAVDVAGLLTGSDLLHALSPEPLDNYAAIIIPSVMLKHGTQLFLDGMQVSELSAQLSTPFVVINDTYSAQELIEACLGQLLN
jgi:putative radical SAM enzyme (TIGR03279 family)